MHTYDCQHKKLKHNPMKILLTYLLRNYWYMIFIVPISIFAIFAVFHYTSFENKREKCLNSFSVKKKLSGKTSSGIITFEGDTVKFYLIPVVELQSACKSEERIIVITDTGIRRCIFSRYVIFEDSTSSIKSLSTWGSNVFDELLERAFLKKFIDIEEHGTTVYIGDH